MLYRMLIIDRYSHLYSNSSTSTRTRTRIHVIIKYSYSYSDSHILQVLVLVLVLVNLVLAPALQALTYWPYFRNVWFDWCETKRMCTSWILGQLLYKTLTFDFTHDFDFEFFKIKFWNTCSNISGIVDLIQIDVKRRVSESFGYSANDRTFLFDHIHNLGIEFASSPFD